MDTRELIALALYGFARIAMLQQLLSAARKLGEESLSVFREIEHEKWHHVADWLDHVSECER